MNLIQFGERYADLRYYKYDKPVAQADDESADEQKPQKLHPCAVLGAQQIQHGGFPHQLNLEPSDCLELFTAMKTTVQECLKDAGGVVIEGPHIRQDKAKLDQLLRDLIKKRSLQESTVNVARRPLPPLSGEPTLMHCDHTL